MLEKIPLRSSLYTAVALNLITAIAVILLRNLLPPQVPVFYGRPSGESQLLPTLGLLIPPAVSLVIIALNTILAAWSKDIFLKKILILTGLLVSVLTAITVFKVVLLVGFF